jgi:hypothetical protein
MAWYRMYVVDRLARFRWPHDFHADNDPDALALANALHYAFSDIPAGIELWQGARRILGAANKPIEALRVDWEQVSAQRQGVLLQMELALFNSGTMIARSRKLQAQIETARQLENSKKAALALASLKTPTAAPSPAIQA